jgi:hypothetical protein
MKARGIFATSSAFACNSRTKELARTLLSWAMKKPISRRSARASPERTILNRRTDQAKPPVPLPVRDKLRQDRRPGFDIRHAAGDGGIECGHLPIAFLHQPQCVAQHLTGIVEPPAGKLSLAKRLKVLPERIATGHAVVSWIYH